ncbi:MAG: HD domain-containing protein [Oscillospiraceae bacterium]|jgi:uncharacterized protein|nr:HD domain-containing protein [Oscillospiraceae bacterium]
MTDKQFDEAAKEILSSPEMKKSKKFVQHGKVSVYSHSLAVAKYSVRFAGKMGIKVDYRSLVRGALLHDFFLYDWHDDWDKLHGFKHPRIALENAKKRFKLNKKEREIIRKHMWPMTFINIPLCREAWLVCIIDKYCSMLETLKISKYNDL